MPDGVIALPYVHLSTQGMGKLQPLLWIQDEDRVRVIDASEFPNEGLVLMQRDFAVLVRDHPLNERLVRIAITENRNSSVDEQLPNYCKFLAQTWRRVPRWMLQHVVTEAFDPQQPRRQLTLGFKPEHPLWVRDPIARAYFGPFDTNVRGDADGSFEVDLIAPNDVAWNLPGGWPEQGIAKVSDLETIEVDDRTYAINTLDRLLSLGRRIEWLDFMDDAQLIDFLRASIGSDDTLPPGAFASLASLVARLPRAGVFDAQRLERAAALIEQVTAQETRWDALVQRHLQSEAGRAALREVVATNPDLVDTRLISDRHPKVLERLGTLAAQIAERQAEADALRTEIDELQRFDRDALVRDRDALVQDLAHLTERLEEKRGELGLAGELTSLREEHARLSEATQQLREEEVQLAREVEELRTTRAHLHEELQRTDDDMRRRLTQLKPYVDALTGGAAPRPKERSGTLPVPAIDPSPPESLGELLDTIHGRLLAMGHRVGREDAANALTALITSPLTVLSGLPGVGKTSLVSRMAAALGMAPHAQFLTVRVPRGWRGRHDVIGYLNPITGHFEEAPTGIYPFLRLHEGGDVGVPGWILFDEANLSPPEHYLSEWLGVMDDDGDRTLLTGNAGERLNVPRHVRLVFTTNQDHTVETLSPRLLDRAAVVVVRGSSRSPDDGAPHVEAAAGSPSVEALDQLLAAVPAELPEGDKRLLDHLIERMGDDDPQLGHPSHVSVRKHALAMRHALTLREMLGRHAGSAPLDGAVATHLVPLLRGRGAGYRKRLEGLEGHLRQMPQAHALLKRILAIGADRFDEYDFQMST